MGPQWVFGPSESLRGLSDSVSPQVSAWISVSLRVLGESVNLWDTQVWDWDCKTLSVRHSGESVRPRWICVPSMSLWTVSASMGCRRICWALSLRALTESVGTQLNLWASANLWILNDHLWSISESIGPHFLKTIRMIPTYSMTLKDQFFYLCLIFGRGHVVSDTRRCVLLLI